MIDHIVHNERVRLQASLLDGLAIISIAGGAIQNILIAAVQSQAGQDGKISLSIFIFFVPLGVILHIAANMCLRSLKEKTQEHFQ